ncbi:MAG: DNA translocase FtsK [Elusimicrobia bacterium]|nr:DNA translocase FtsK [Elusimicrobiota bacterium]
MKLFRSLQKDERRHEIYGLLLVTASLLIILSLIPGPGGKNFIGAFGHLFSKCLKEIFGLFGAYFIPLVMVIWGYERIEHEEEERFYLQIAGVLLLLISSCTLISLIKTDEYIVSGMWGGYVGTFGSKFLRRGFGPVGAGLILVSSLMVSIVFTTEFSLIEFFNMIKAKMEDFKEMKLFSKKSSGPKEAKPMIKRTKELPEIKVTEKPAKPLIHLTQKRKLDKPTISTPLSVKSESMPKKPRIAGAFILPPISLLNTRTKDKGQMDERELQQNAQLLQQTLANFGIEAQVVEIHPGPVITRYDLLPSSGVKVGRIVALENDIALALRAARVRILAPIPGKNAVGIEIPNSKPQVVSLREIFESKEFQTDDSKLTLALGKTVSGQTTVADLQEMPHLLIAGTTGSGKSVCINALIISIAYKATPDEVKFLMIDPKTVELPIYNGIPHLLAPVTTSAKQAAGALRGMVTEMERRYKILAGVRARNIDIFNKMPGVEKMPYLVVIIDELADLMMLASIEVEDTIMRLAQMSRAVGIHLVLATQRPTVDVITGIIKANFPARIAFYVQNKLDSRIILDTGGAEDLAGRGDMLFLPPGAPAPVRLQGALVTEDEICRIVEFLSKQGQPEYKEDIIQSAQNPESDSHKMEKDERFMEAVKLVLNSRQASISLLQRRLGIGYNHAGRIIDQMEEEGLIGPPDGTKPREVLADENYLRELEKQNEIQTR